VVNTGNGKGKSSAAFGVVARALGHGLRVGVVQFVKGRSDTGEEAFFRKQPGVAWHVGGEGFTGKRRTRSATRVPHRRPGKSPAATSPIPRSTSSCSTK
jgi:ATP:corrinoid adenosyltransferase